MAATPDAGMTPADFAGIATTAGFQMGVVSLSSKGWSRIKEAIAAAKGGEALRFGTMNPKLFDLAYLLGKAQGVEFNIVQVRGGRAVVDGVNAGDLDLGFMAAMPRPKRALSGIAVLILCALDKGPQKVSPQPKRSIRPYPVPT